MTIKKTGENAYFAASNSAKGFYCYYSQCFDAQRVTHVYAVKGGPGTGKSRFLREVAEAGERRGWCVEYVYCSSDPDSLDGVILTGEGRCIALLDATAPHIYEPTHPGVREDIVNLGAFWDAEKLAEQAQTIAKWNEQKSAAYRQAYRYLEGAGLAAANLDEVIAPFIRLEPLRAFARRLLREIPMGAGYSAEPALISSIGMRGEVRLDTYLAQASTLYRIEDCHGCARYLLAQIGALAVEKRLETRLSYDPLLPDRLDGIFLRESGVAFVVSSEGDCPYPHRTLTLRRFVDTAAMREVRGMVGYAERMKRAMLDGAKEMMEKVRMAHFEVEACYVAAMDFDAKERFTKHFCEHLFG